MLYTVANERNNEAEMKTKLTAFRIPEGLKEAAMEYCKNHDLRFSQLVRRAIRRELNQRGVPVLPEEQD